MDIPILSGQSPNLMGMPPQQPMQPPPMPTPGLDMPVFSQQIPQPNTVLSSPDVQQKAGKMTNMLLEDWISGHNKQARDQQLPTKIFAGAAGVLGGLLGGGYAQGGQQVLQQANQHIQNAKAEQNNRNKDAIEGLRFLNNFVNTTSPESQNATALYLKTMQKQKDQQMQQQKLDATDTYRSAKLALQKQHEDNWATRQSALTELGKRGFDLDQKRFEVNTQLAKQRMQNSLLITKIQQQMAQDKNNQQLATTLANLMQRQKIYDNGYAVNTQKLLADLTAKKAEMQNGAPKYDPKQLDTLIQSISGAPQPQAEVDLSGLLSPDEQNEYSKAFDNAMQETQSVAPQAAPTPTTSRIQSGMSKIQAIRQKFGVSQEDAIKMAKEHGVQL